MPPSPERHLNSRQVAAQLLYQGRHPSDFPSRLLETVQRDRAFVTEIVLGVIRNQRALDWMVSRLASRPPAAVLQSVLHVGLYQLLYLDHVEPYAAVHETVEAAKAMSGQKGGGFVNAILRRALRERTALLDGLAKQPLDVRLSHPKELVDRWIARYGRKRTEQLCEWNNQRPDLVLRVRDTTSVEALLHELHSAGVPAQLHVARSDFIVLGACAYVDDLPGYAQGRFVVQDPATMVAVDMLAAQPGQRIFDACAAPGGKVIAIADQMEQQGYLIAADLNPLRLARLKENLKRCGCTFVKTDTLDATELKPHDEAVAGFDGILLDVPCSNTGVIRRRPEARRRINPKTLKQLVTLQEEILDRAWPLLAAGGRMVYSTCSLEPEENEGQIEAFLSRHPEAICLDQIQLFPPNSGTDGSYAACLIRG